MSYISVKNLNIKFDNNILFKDITFDIEKSSLTSITTPSSKGKTLLLNILCGNVKTDSVFINDKIIDQKIKSKIVYIDENITFYSKTILEELLLVSNNTSKIKKYLKEFKLLDYINTSPLNLSYVNMQKLKLLSALLMDKEIILIDNIFSYFDKYSKVEYIGLLKKYQCDKKKTIIYTTNNLEDTIFSDKIIIINTTLIYSGSVDKIYLNEKIIKKGKINIPLENELLEKLKLYNVIDKVTYTVEEMVDIICK